MVQDTAMAENLREIINGTLLPQYNNKKVSLTGCITSVNPNGMTFEMNTVDDVNVKVNLKKPQRDITTGYVEVHGTAQGKTIMCDEVIPFSQEESSNFDAASHNILANLLHSIPDLWKTE